ncbi:MAG TPA: flagellar basal body P-ring formation chaperone FlgA [Burkholderiaceae bacterium]
MFRLVCSIGLAALAALGPCRSVQAGEAVHATIRAEASAEGRSVTLGDLAELSGAAAEQLASLAHTRLAAAPQPGGTLHLTKRQVTRLLREAGVAAIVVDGADDTLVTATSVTLDMNAVVATAKAKLAEELRQNGQTLELTPQDDMHELRLPHGSVALTARNAPHRDLHSRMSVYVDVLLDGQYYRTVPVTFSVSAAGPVLVARHDLPKGAVLDCNDTESQQRDLAALASPPLTGDCAALLKRTKRNLAAGEVLLANAAEPLPAVSEGQYVTLKVAEGAVVIESRALALTDGEMGQRIPVKPTMGEEPVLAVVVAPGLVNLSEK